MVHFTTHPFIIFQYDFNPLTKSWNVREQDWIGPTGSVVRSFKPF